MRTHPTDSWLSWKHRRSQFRKPIPFVQKVDLFYERILGWQLVIADKLVNGLNGHEPIPHAAFGALHICLSYFEMIGKYEAGYNQDDASTKHFKLGLKSVFPYLRRSPSARFDKVAELLYKAARCGLYHAAQTGPGILLRRQRSVLRFNSRRGSITIDPHRLPVLLQDHLLTYRRRLEGGRNVKLCQDFEARFDHDNPGLA